jgi:hypothetical protein
LPPPRLPEDLDRQGRAQLDILSAVLGSGVLVGAGLCWFVHWSVAVVGGAAAAMGIVFWIVKLDELQRRWRWRDWPEKYRFIPGAGNPMDRRLSGYVIEVPAGHASAEEWQRFLTEMLALPQSYGEVRWLARRAERNLVRRSPAISAA